MATLARTRDDAQITLIDATELDDEQFNDLITSIDPCGSIFPLLFGVLAFLLTLAMLA